LQPNKKKGESRLFLSVSFLFLLLPFAGMEGKTTRKTHLGLEGEDEGEEHGADRGVKKMGEQKWHFSYGERAVLRKAGDGDDFDNETSSDECQEEEEEEEEEEESTALALAQVYTTCLPSEAGWWASEMLRYKRSLLRQALYVTCPPSVSSFHSPTIHF